MTLGLIWHRQKYCAVPNPVLVCIHRSWLTSTAASFYFVPSCWHDKVITLLPSRGVSAGESTLAERGGVIVSVYLFSAWPLLLAAVSLTVWGWHFTSVYLDSQPVVVVWIWIMNPFRIPFRRCWVPVAMATVHLWLRERERDTLWDRFDQWDLFLLSISLSFSFSPVLVGPQPLSLFSSWWINLVLCQGCVVRIECSSAKWSRSHFQGFSSCRS